MHIINELITRVQCAHLRRRDACEPHTAPLSSLDPVLLLTAGFSNWHLHSANSTVFVVCHSCVVSADDLGLVAVLINMEAQL